MKLAYAELARIDRRELFLRAQKLREKGGSSSRLKRMIRFLIEKGKKKKLTLSLSRVYLELYQDLFLLLHDMMDPPFVPLG